MVTIAGAFSGLISYGVFQIRSYIPGWKYLFIIEGGATLVLAAFAVWWLPRSGSECHWFNEAEKHVAKMRLLHDGSTRTGAATKLEVKKALRTLMDWHVWAWAVIAFCYGVPQSSVSNFMPQMVELLGYGTVRTNLLTVAPYCVGTVVLWCTCFSSDYFRERSFHLASTLCLTLIGYIILISVDPTSNKHVGYFACFLLAMGAFTCSCIYHTWYSNNIIDESRRAATVGFLVGAANCAGIPSSLAFKDDTAPRYIPALIVNCAFLATGITMIVSMGTYLRLDNRRRDKLQGVHLRAQDIATKDLIDGWNDPNWRWTV